MNRISIYTGRFVTMLVVALLLTSSLIVCITVSDGNFTEVRAEGDEPIESPSLGTSVEVSKYNSTVSVDMRDSNFLDSIFWGIIGSWVSGDKEKKLTDCVYSSNGLVFSFTDPYNKNSTDATYGYLDQNKYDYSVSYGADGSQAITYNSNGDRTQSATGVPLAWLCGYDDNMNTRGKETLDVPAVINYNNKEYFVAGCLDGYDVWGDGSYFSQTPFSKVTFHIAYDHYSVPSYFFRSHQYLESCTFNYEHYTIKSGNTSYYSKGFINYIGDLAFNGCTKLRELNLPEKINIMGYGCFSDMGLNYFIFNTSVHSYKSLSNGTLTGYVFSGNTNLTDLYIGKNADNLPNNLFSKTSGAYNNAGSAGCPDITTVYNAGAKNTQNAVEAAVSNSGATSPHRVFIFNLCGGELESLSDNISPIGKNSLGEIYNVASLGDDGNLSMPLAYVMSHDIKTYIPAWGVKVGGSSATSEEESILTNRSDDLSKYPATGIITYYGTCTVHYYLDGELLGTQDLVCEYATGVFSPTSFPKLNVEGSAFECWNTSADGTGDVYLSGQTITSSVDVDLYAQGVFKKIIKITYVYGTKSGRSTYETTKTQDQVVDEDKFPSKITDGTRGGTTSSLPSSGITHWSTTSSVDGNSVLYAVGSVITLTKDATLYAYAKPDNTIMTDYSITYHSGYDGDPTTIVDKESKLSTVTSVDMVVSPNDHFVREGYLFNGWVKVSGESVSIGSSVTLQKATPTLDLYASWTEIVHDFTVKLNFNNGSGLYDEREVTDNTPVVLDAPEGCYRPGYTLLGWGFYEDSGYINFSLEDSYYIVEDLELYAVWEKNNVDVTDVFLILKNSYVAYNGNDQYVYAGNTVIGLDSQHTLVFDEESIRVYDSNLVELDGRSVSDEGVYILSVDKESCRILVDGEEDDMSKYLIHVYPGIFTIHADAGYSILYSTIQTS